MNILHLTSAAAIAAASLGIAGAASAGPAVNLSAGTQDVATQSDKGAVTPVYHRYHYGYGYSPYYYAPRYYYPRYRYYQPYYYGNPYYYSPGFNFGIQIR